MSNFNIDGFLNSLEQNQPRQKDMSPKQRSLEKLYLSFTGNYGKYQIFPLNSTVTGFPYVYLNGTREIKIVRKNVLPDGTENSFDAWIKLLPSEGYKMIDASGRIVSSLTTEDENLLSQATSTFDALYDALGGNQKEDLSLNKTQGFLRKRNYTIWHGKCLNKWGLSDPRNAERQNFAALFVCTARGFSDVINASVADASVIRGGDNLWLEQVYNRNLNNRTGFLLFSISMGSGGKVGYNITATHETDRGQTLLPYSITPEEEELMRDPVETFLGWQAGKQEPGRLFNKGLIQEAIAHMSQQLQAVRMAQSTGSDLVEAMNNTLLQALETGVNYTATSNDPILGGNKPVQSFSGMSNPGSVFNSNTSPFQTPPAAHVDPVSVTPSAPERNSAPFVQPAFAQGNNPSPFGN